MSDNNFDNAGLFEEGALLSFLQDQYQLDDKELILNAVEIFTLTDITPAKHGSLSARLPVSVPLNAVPGNFMLKITAKAADQAIAGVVGQIRGEDGTATNEHEIIVDFGTVRTVSSVLFSVNCRVERVDNWTGTEFNAWPSNAPFFDPDIDRPDGRYAKFRSDIRTERLRITVFADQTTNFLVQDLRLVLPDAPKDLSISIDGGPPVWSLAGSAAPGVGAELTDDKWNGQNQRLVDLTDALRAKTGDPLNAAERTFELTLTSREAGVLQIEQANLEYGVIVRAGVIGTSGATVTFDSEGITDVTLSIPDTPAGSKATSLTVQAVGAFAPERRVPAIGPFPVLVSDPAGAADPSMSPLVEVDITAERAMILRLEPVAGLPAIAGLRLPLRPGPEGAEIRLLPWENMSPDQWQPLVALDDLTGALVTLDAATGPWSTLLFDAPLEVDPLNPPWVALLVTRGTVSVALSDDAGAVMRVGPPSGPWRRMPAIFDTPAFANLRFPYRTIGDAANPVTNVPLLIEVTGAVGAPVALDPVPEGSWLTLAGLNTANPALRITHFAAGSFDLNAVDIIFES